MYHIVLAVAIGSAAMGCDPSAAASDGECSEDGFPFAVPSFGLELRQYAGVDFGRSFTHPFVLSLANGSLARSTFKFYQMQDARYLEALSDVSCITRSNPCHPSEHVPLPTVTTSNRAARPPV